MKTVQDNQKPNKGFLMKNYGHEWNNEKTKMLHMGLSIIQIPKKYNTRAKGLQTRFKS